MKLTGKILVKVLEGNVEELMIAVIKSILFPYIISPIRPLIKEISELLASRSSRNSIVFISFAVEDLKLPMHSRTIRTCKIVPNPSVITFKWLSCDSPVIGLEGMKF